MRNVILTAVVITVCFLLFRTHAQSVEIMVLQDKLADSSRRIALSTLDLQDKCAKQALEAFKIGGWQTDHSAGFEDHFNVSLNKCFVQVTDSEVKAGAVTATKNLSDAFEGKAYGNYVWVNAEHKKSWEVQPVECTVRLPSGEDKHCHSSEEFDELVKQYMQ